MSVVIEKKISETFVLNRDWIRVQVDQIQFDQSTKTAERIVITHPGAACILAVTDDEKVLLVSQYRYPTKQALYEIPAGKVDNWSNDYYQTAARELAEETPFTAEKLELLYTFYVAPGYCNEYLHLYKATGLQKNSALSLDEDEFLHVEYFSKDEVKAMLHDGTIRDAKTIIALQYWLYEDGK